MANKEFNGSVEYSVKRTAEASEIVFNAIQPIARASLDNILLAGYLFSPSHSKLKIIFGALYFPSYKKREERRQNP